MPEPIQTYVRKLLSIVAQLQQDYPKKKFTLDGRLAGDIGEIIAEQKYDLELLEGLVKTHDAVSHGKYIQIKTTMKRSLGFGDIPDYYLGLRVDEEGNAEEIYNGPGTLIWEEIKHLKRPKNFLIPVSINKLRKLNKEVPPHKKIKLR